MISKRLASVAAAAFVLALGMPSLAGASLRIPGGRHRVPRTHKRLLSSAGCRLSLTVEPHRVTAGDESPQLFGQLKCPSAETTGQTVTIDGREAGQLAKVIGTTTTITAGYYTFVAPAPTVNTIFYASTPDATSTERLVKVAPQVTLTGPSESKALFTGFASRVTFAGTVSAADAGANLVLQREAATADEEWVTIQRGVVGAGGAYTIVHEFRRPGDANIRVLVRAQGQYTVYGASSPLSYVISQKENALLTLNATSTGASSDPISYGQTITLKGAVVGGASKPVTLLGRTAGATFTTVATAVANASGQYSFEETPLQDTAYRVLSATGTHSAVLFEGVKYVLSEAISTMTLQAGQTFTIAGTVTPYHANHVVYLERENASGAGFHVAAVGTLNAPAAGSTAATYSIIHTVFGPGKQVYRVKVPGDPDNQGEASSPFTIEVTPAPAGSLRPGPPIPLPPEATS
jgi:hypothetical protein